MITKKRSWSDSYLAVQELGMGSQKKVLCLVEAILMKKQGVSSAPVSKGWWESFQKRHPQLTLRCPETLSYARAIASSREVVDDYFDLLEETLARNDLTNKPAEIFNCDETGFPLCPEAVGKLIAVKGQKHFWVNSSSEKAQITVLACASASGYVLPPMVIYDRQRLTNVLMKNEVPGTLYGLSKKGWINRELFLKWFQRHFLTHAPPARPLLLLLDGHSSHYAPDLVRLAAQAGVILFVLPPNTTHFVQPLDKTVFGPLKVYWWQECQNFMARNPGTVITRGDFNEIFSRAWFRGLTSANVLSAFKATGIHPLDRYAVQIPGEDNKKKTLPAKASSDIAFLPLYSPAPRHKHCQSIAEKRSTTSSLDLSQCSQQSSTSSPTHQPLSIASLDTWSDDDDEEMAHSESGYELLDHSLHPSSIDSGNGQFHDGFTDDEVNRFNVRFENGYDLKSDTRYWDFLLVSLSKLVLICLYLLYVGSQRKTVSSAPSSSQEVNPLGAGKGQCWSWLGVWGAWTLTNCLTSGSKRASPLDETTQITRGETSCWYPCQSWFWYVCTFSM